MNCTHQESRFVVAALWAGVVLAACGNGAATQSLPIGSPCSTSLQCGTATPWFCDRDHPNGYCKKDCVVDGDCPPEAICAHDGGVGECHKRCTLTSDCRAGEGYACKPASSDAVTFASHAYCDVADNGGDGGVPSDARPSG